MNKKKLIALISALEDEKVIDYLWGFTLLRLHWSANLPKQFVKEAKERAGEVL